MDSLSSLDKCSFSFLTGSLDYKLSFLGSFLAEFRGGFLPVLIAGWLDTSDLIEEFKLDILCSFSP